MTTPPSPARSFHPALSVSEIWPGPAGYPWAGTGTRCWTREGILRRVGENGLVVAYTTGGMTEPWEGNFTMLRRSENNGETWTDAGVFRHPGRGLFTSEIFAARSGELHALLSVYPRNAVWMTQNHNYRAISRDGGKSWEGPHSLPGGVQGVWPNYGITLDARRWVIPVCWCEHTGEEWAEPIVGTPPVAGQIGHRLLPQVRLPVGTEDTVWGNAGCAWADRNHRYVCGVVLSDDEGQTFRLRGYIRGGLHGHLIEPRVIPLSTGRLVMLIRSQRDGRLWTSHSDDQGETWAEATRTEIPNPAAKVCLLKDRRGRIYLIHNPVGLEGLTYGGRNPLSLWVSDDDMQTWTRKVELIRDANPAQCLNYPDGFIDEARGEIVMCWEDAVSVFLTRIPLDIGG